MGWSRRLFFGAFRGYSSRFAAPKGIGCESLSIKKFPTFFCKQPIFSRSRVYETWHSSFRNSSLRNGIMKNQQSPFSDVAKRFYYVDRQQVYHFKHRGYKRWFQNPINVFIVVVVSSGVVISIYFGNLETVPYTKRRHFVLLSKSLEIELGDTLFQEMKKEFSILPPLHPDSIRVRNIAQDIIEALQKGLRNDRVWNDIGYSPEIGVLPLDRAHAHGTAKALSDKLEDDEKWQGEDKWHKDDEVLDDKWIQHSRKKGKDEGVASQTAHLQGLKWEVIVVNDPLVNAMCVPGGKIIVFSGLLEHFKADTEIATIIGHEVSHAVARHTAEQISKNLWLGIFQLILYTFVTPDIVNTMSNLLLRLPFSRRMEMEADYIGLLLMASAGYDPREAPQVYEKLGKVGGDSSLQDYLATHPSGKKRAQLLAQAKVMEEALAIYREAVAGRGVEGFL